MSKENKATVYGLDKGAYLLNKKPYLMNDAAWLKYDIQRSEMYFMHTKEYTKYEHANVLFWTELEDTAHLKFKVTHHQELIRNTIDEKGNKHYFVIHPELLNSTLGQYVVHLENKLKEQGIAPMFIQYK